MITENDVDVFNKYSVIKNLLENIKFYCKKIINLYLSY